MNIVGSASSFGLVFVGSSNAEIFVICTKDLELPTALDQNAPVRKIPMPSPVTQLATNCDGSILAVAVKINGVPHIQMYSVPSFLTPVSLLKTINIRKLLTMNIYYFRTFKKSANFVCQPITRIPPITNINDSFEIPELIDITVKDTEHFEIPATQELTDDLKSPQIQNLSINENEHEEFPATQDMSPEHEEILTTQEVSDKQGQLISISGIQDASARSTATNKIPFSVYEDSICEVPQVAHKPSIVQPLNQSTANMSRKENLIVPQFKRTNSDEFLDLCKSFPQLNYKPAQAIGNQPRNKISDLPKNEISDLPRNEISDLLKFSDAKSKLSLEATFNDLQINKPFKSPSPTMNIFEADLNTEKFNLPLKFGINSTVIGDVTKVVPVTKKPELNEFLDLSIEMNEDEFGRLGKNKSQAAEKGTS